MKNKFKKTMRIMVVVLALCMIAPLASAFIRDSLADMRANPSKYYIWHDRIGTSVVDTEMRDIINNFATQMGGVEVRTSQRGNDNFIIIATRDSTFADDYVFPIRTSYVDTSTGGAFDYTSIYLTIEPGYEEYISRLVQTDPGIVNELDLDGSGDLSVDEVYYDYLNIILDYLLTYSTWPNDEMLIKAASRQIVGEGTITTLTCAEFSDYDNTYWFKDEYLYQGQRWEDLCDDINTLFELGCVSSGPDVGYVRYFEKPCPRGCSSGRCIYTVFFLIYQYEQGDISESNFDSALDAWIGHAEPPPPTPTPTPTPLPSPTSTPLPSPTSTPLPSPTSTPSPSPSPDYDLNGDSRADGADIIYVVTRWGNDDCNGAACDGATIMGVVIHWTR